MRNLATRSRLLLLLILAAVPALALTLYNGLAQRTAAESQARMELAALARSAAQIQARSIDSAKQLLVGFSLAPPNVRADKTLCAEYLRKTLQKAEHLYLSMGLYGADGQEQCSSAPVDRSLKQALETGRLSVGEFARAPASKPEGITLNYPIVSPERGTTEVAFLVLGLQELGQQVAKLPLPQGGVLTVIDRNGVVLARSPSRVEILGKPLAPAQTPESLRAGTSGVYANSGDEGMAQLVAFESVLDPAGDPEAMKVLVSVPMSVIFAEANAMMVRSLAIGALITLLLLIGAWYAADHFFLRNVRTLLDTANRIRKGDLNARTGMSYGNEELSQIGKAFDEMAETLQQRQQRIDMAMETLHKQSITDALTGLHNRRYLYELLPREIVLAKRHGQTIGVLMIDLDHFKSINDTYGHEAGDMALRWVGHMLMKNVRGSDIVCRFGGEEFCVVLPQASLLIAQAKAEEIRIALEQLSLDYCGKPLKITASFGVAVYPQHGTVADSLLRVADEALYEAKKTGRNRVVVFSGEAAVKDTVNEMRSAAMTERPLQSAPSPLPSVVSHINAGTANRGKPPGPASPRARDTTAVAGKAASLQILNGSMVGEQIPLIKPDTTIGKTDGEMAVVSRTAQGYSIAHIGGEKHPVVNGSTIELKSYPLADRDVIEVAGVKMVFFLK